MTLPQSLDDILPESSASEVESSESVAESSVAESSDVVSAAVDPTVQVTVDDQVPEVA